MVHLNGSTLMTPRVLSNKCRDAAMRLAMLDSRYQQWHRELTDELAENGESDNARIIALRLHEIQQEITDIYGKVRLG